MKLDEFQRLFNPHFAFAIDALLESSKKQTQNAMIHAALDHLQKISLNGGKRIRPYIASLGYEGLGKDDGQKILNVLCAIELFHLFALVQDDVMDASNTRHGEQTVHAYLMAKQSQKQRDAEGYAILLGDLLLNTAHQKFFEMDHSKNLENTKGIFLQMSEEVMLGQMIDISLSGKMNATVDELMESYKLKTAFYTIVRPLQIGTALAGADESVLAWCEAFGEPLGLAFQMQDDLLDVLPSEKTGKTTCKDLQAGQPTIITAFIQKEGTAEEKKILADYFGKELTDDGMEKFVGMILQSKILGTVTQLIEAKFEEAAVALKNAPTKQLGSLGLELVSTLQQRKK